MYITVYVYAYVYGCVCVAICRCMQRSMCLSWFLSCPLSPSVLAPQVRLDASAGEFAFKEALQRQRTETEKRDGESLKGGSCLKP